MGVRLAALAAVLAARGVVGDASLPDPFGRRLQEANASKPADPAQSLVGDDVNNVACTEGESCTAGSIPENRGLCILGAPNTVDRTCRDVCNPKYAPKSYKVSQTNDTLNSGYAGLVSQVRAGFNSFVQCPGELGDPCPPGDPCGVHKAKEYNVPEGKGLCVVDSSQPQSRACWDMCDASRSPEDFEEGTSGAAKTVEEARAGAICADGRWPWWAWVLLFLLLACCAGVLCVASGLIKTKRSRAGASPDSRGLDYEQGDDERREKLAYDGGDHGYEQQKQLAYDEAYAQGGHDGRGESHPRDVVVDNYDMPPEPARLHTYADAPPPEPSPFPDEVERSGYGGASASRGPPLGSSIRAIPGLDEPCLFPSVQPLVMPTTTAQMAPPELLGLTSQLAPSGSQSALGTSHVLPSYAVSAAGPYQQPGSALNTTGSGGIPYVTQINGLGR